MNDQKANTRSSDPSHGVNWEARWSRQGQLWQPARLHEVMMRFGNVPDMISMHGGLPPPSAFPVCAAVLHLADGDTASLMEPSHVVAAQQYNLHKLVRGNMHGRQRTCERRHQPSAAATPGLSRVNAGPLCHRASQSWWSGVATLPTSCNVRLLRWRWCWVAAPPPRWMHLLACC
jgi:hypothetical protein